MIWRSRSVSRTGALQFEPFAVEGERPKRNLLDQRLRRRHAAFQDIVDAQHQFARLERLGEIVVGAGFKAGDAALAFRARGQQHDGHVQRLAQALDQRHAVLSGHHNVDDEEIEGQPGEALARFGGVAGDGDAETAIAEIAREEKANALVVVNDEEVGSVVGEDAILLGIGQGDGSSIDISAQ
jgi:hypothetical protein